MAKLTILMATTNGNISQNENFLAFPFQENCKALVCNQKIHTTEDLVIDIPFVDVLNTADIGISNNRNTGIQHANSEYLHFCDDDVELLPTYFETIQQAIQQNPETDIFAFQIQKNESQLFKNYSTQGYTIQQNTLWNRRKLLKISSIEIVVKQSFIKKNNLFFNPKLGLGNTNYPMGEEIFFLLDALAKGAIIQYIPMPIAQHPSESTGSNLQTPHLRSLGVVYKKVFGMFSYPFMAYYAFKKSQKLASENISIIRAVQTMWNAKLKEK